jgi:hypothetical protein
MMLLGWSIEEQNAGWLNPVGVVDEDGQAIIDIAIHQDKLVLLQRICYEKL